MGYNYHGQIKPNSKDSYILELEKRIAELEKPKIKHLKKWNFSKIMGEDIKKGSRPWDF